LIFSGVPQVLIEKDWVSFGHKFKERCAQGGGCPKAERSPVFIQWLDCVHQLLQQFPVSFEFTQDLLLILAEHLHSGLYADFLFNSECERRQAGVAKNTISIWAQVCLLKFTHWDEKAVG
jgi:hypothetical protein